MAIFVVAFIFSFLFYLLLTFGSGNLGFWAFEEILFGILFAALTALLSKKLSEATGIKFGSGSLNPKRLALFIVYLVGPFFFEMAKANIDVAYRVITGKIKPGIVKISPKLKNDYGTTLLANSITLTPGTLTVDVDKDRNLYIHWIYVKNKTPKCEDVCASFVKWARRITE